MKNLVKKMLKSKKVWVALIVLVMVIVGWSMLGGKSSEPRGMMVTTTAAEQKDIEESLTLKAPLEGSESVEVVSNLHYEILQINVKEGDKVTKGQVLAVLDSEKLRNDIESSQDALELATLQNKEKLEDDQLAYEKAVESLQSVQTQYERTKTLADHGGVSQEELEQAENALNDAKRLVEGYAVKDGRVTSNSSSQKNIEIAQKNLTRKQDELADIEIKSTIDGTVTRVNTRVGRFADDTEDKKPMFVVENLDQLQMQVEVSEYDISKIVEGQDVQISADILKGDAVAGVVARISPTGEQKAGSTTERVIPIQINVLEQHEKLIAGITAKAKILISKAEQALVVPIEALKELDDGQVQVAKVEKDNTVKWITVQVGIETDLEAQIVSDQLQAGDNIIISPGAELVDGTAVQVMGGVN